MSTKDMPEFETGDMVICINNDGIGARNLIVGSKYIAVSVTSYIGDWWVAIRDLHGNPINSRVTGPLQNQWLADRFILSESANIEATQSTSTVSSAVNDHVCLSCGNTKCSKTENTCWKCGNPL